jgi:hypothetical protein
LLLLDAERANPGDDEDDEDLAEDFGEDFGEDALLNGEDDKDDNDKLDG